MSSPSKAEAVHYLRQLADTIDMGSRDNPELDGARLRLIADCIEGGKRCWRKGGKLTGRQREVIDAVARLAYGPDRASISEGLARDAARLAGKFGWHEPNDVERVRDLLTAARRKLRRK